MITQGISSSDREVTLSCRKADNGLFYASCEISDFIVADVAISKDVYDGFVQVATRAAAGDIKAVAKIAAIFAGNCMQSKLID